MTTLPHLSSIIPSLYYQTGSKFVDFMEQYYQWFDGTKIDLATIRDPDNAEAQFVTRFLDEYGPTISVNSKSNNDLLAHHITELYRSKGSPRSIDLFFRLVYGVSAETRFPREQVFSTSSNTYRKLHYVEVTNSPILADLLNQVVRFSNGAVAYVETIKQQQGLKTVHNVMVLSDIIGFINVGDMVYKSNATRSQSPRIVGSLSSIDIYSSSEGFEVGLPVTYQSENGTEGSGYITSVAEVSTKIDYALVSGGTGYTMYPEIRVSDKILDVSNVVTSSGTRFPISANVFQNVFTATYGYSSNVDYKVGDTVYLQSVSGNTITSNVAGRIAYWIPTGDAGSKLIIESSATLANVVAANTLVIANGIISNVVVATSNATGKIVDQLTDVCLTVNTLHHPVINGDMVYQFDGANAVVASGKAVMTQTADKVYLANCTGSFSIGGSIKTSSNVASANANVVADVVQGIGIDQVTGTFYPNAKLTVSNTTAYTLSVSTGSGANVGVYMLEGTIDILSQAPDPAILARSPSQVTMGANTYTKVTVGSIAGLKMINRGINYDRPPIITIKQPLSQATANGIKILTTTSTLNFSPGEFIKQIGSSNGCLKMSTSNTLMFNAGDVVYCKNSTANLGVGIIDRIIPSQHIYLRAVMGTFSNTATIILASNSSVNTTSTNAVVTGDLITARGRILSKNNTTLTVLTHRDLVSCRFVAGGQVIGEYTGAVANVTAVANSATSQPGNNAVIQATLQIVNGSISSVSVENSGIGFQENGITYIKTSDGKVVATGVSHTSATGSTEGYFETQKGMTSSSQFLADPHYYQPHSYVVTTSVDISNNEADHKFLQVAGMKMYIESEVSDTVLMDADVSESSMTSF